LILWHDVEIATITRMFWIYIAIARLLRDGTKPSRRMGSEGATRQRSKPVMSYSNAETGCQHRTELSVPHISIRGYGLVRSAHTWKLSSAHVPSLCNRALPESLRHGLLHVLVHSSETEINKLIIILKIVLVFDTEIVFSVNIKSSEEPVVGWFWCTVLSADDLVDDKKNIMLLLSHLCWKRSVVWGKFSINDGSEIYSVPVLTSLVVIVGT
jgi:hypothetical protein